MGGTRRDDRSLTPIVVLEPLGNARFLCEEIFGPVTCVYGFTDLKEAIARANSLPFVFQASIFTGELEPALMARSCSMPQP